MLSILVYKSKKLDVSLSLFGSILLIGMKKAKMVSMAKGILLLVSLSSSDTLIFISIKMNKNKIETAPTYTNKYDIPIKVIPINIKLQDIVENSKIRNSTETIGFLLIIINIPDVADMIIVANKIIEKYSLFNLFISIKLVIAFFFCCPIWLMFLDRNGKYF